MRALVTSERKRVSVLRPGFHHKRCSRYVNALCAKERIKSCIPECNQKVRQHPSSIDFYSISTRQETDVGIKHRGRMKKKIGRFSARTRNLNASTLLSNFTSQSQNNTTSVFLPVMVDTKMGNCFTLLFSNNKSVDNDTKMNEKVESEELLQIPSVEVHAQPASSIVSFQSELDLSVGDSCATIDFDADDESSSSGTLLFDSEDEYDVSKLQGEALNLPKKSRQLARNTNRAVQLHGLGRKNDVQSHALPPVERPASSSFKNRKSVKEVGDNARDTALARQRSHTSNRATKPIKREQLTEEKAERKPPRFLRKKRRDKKMQTNKVQFIKIFKNTIRRKALRNTDSGSPVLPPDKTDVQVFNADAKDYSDSRSDDGATSCSRPSTATLGEDTPGTSTGYHFRYVLSVQEKTRVTKTRSSSTNSSGSSTTVGDNHGKDETKNEYVAGVPRLAAVTPWYSSTSSEEDLGRLRFHRPYRVSKSTTVKAQNELHVMARTPPSTNLWDSSSTLVESEESSVSCNENDIAQTPKDQRIEKSSSTAQSSNSVSSWNSSSNCEEDTEKESSESVSSRQRGVTSRKWFRFKICKITPQ